MFGVVRIDRRLADRWDFVRRSDAYQRERIATVAASLSGGLHDARLSAPIPDRDPLPAVHEQTQPLEHRHQLALVELLHSRGTTAEEHERIGLTPNVGDECREALIPVGRSARDLEDQRGGRSRPG